MHQVVATLINLTLVDNYCLQLHDCLLMLYLQTEAMLPTEHPVVHPACTQIKRSTFKLALHNLDLDCLDLVSQECHLSTLSGTKSFHFAPRLGKR